MKNTRRKTAADMNTWDSSSKISSQHDEKDIEGAVSLPPVSHNDSERSSENDQNGANELATVATKADEATKAEDRINENKTERDTFVKTEQIGADEDGDKVMQDNRIEDDDAKFHCSPVLYESGGVAAAVNKVQNNRPPFATDELEVANSFEYLNRLLRAPCMMQSRLCMKGDLSSTIQVTLQSWLFTTTEEAVTVAVCASCKSVGGYFPHCVCCDFLRCLVICRD